jgi:hypothetical protein
VAHIIDQDKDYVGSISLWAASGIHPQQGQYPKTQEYAY